MKQKTISYQISRAWNKVPLIIRSILSGVFVSSAGIACWGLLLTTMAVPWSIIPMIFVLWAFYKFFNGSWGSTKNRQTKQNNFRKIKLSPSVWKWSIAAAILFVIIVQASFVVTFRFVDFPAEQFTAEYKLLDDMAPWISVAIIVMSSMVAAVCEETGFRGYLQAPLEKKYGPTAAIIITALVFTAIHLNHSWARQIVPHIFFASILLGLLAYRSGSLIPGIIGHAVLDVCDYSFWWSDITGGFQKQTIFKTGIDIHFIVWALILALAVFGFFRFIVRSKISGHKMLLETNVPGLKYELR